MAATLSAVANEPEKRRWNDHRWTDVWPDRERLTETVTPYLFGAAGVSPGQTVSDIGCGGGGTTIALGRTVGPEGEVVGYDISAPLLELARRRAAEAGVANVRFIEMDVQAGEWAEGECDLAVSQFGIMFFDEPTVAFGAIRRHLVPGGRFVFACWQGVERNPWHVGSALRPLLPPPPTPAPGKSPVGPFALGDDEYVRELLEAAGFVDVAGTAHETTVRAPASAIVSGDLLSFMGVPAERAGEAVAMVDAHLARFAVDGGGRGEGGGDRVGDGVVYEYPLAFSVYEARRG